MVIVRTHVHHVLSVSEPKHLVLLLVAFDSLNRLRNRDHRNLILYEILAGPTEHLLMNLSVTERVMEKCPLHLPP
jgi:hypothetical protein